MKTAALPQGFPVGRLNLSGTLSRAISGRATGYSPSLPPMISPYGGVAPKREQGSTQQGDVAKIQARGKGTLSQLVAAKARPDAVAGMANQAPRADVIPRAEAAEAAKELHGVGDAAQEVAQKAARAILRESLSKSSMAMRPVDMVSFMSHAFDKRHATRFRADPVKLLEPALKQMKEVRPLPELAGHGFVANLPAEHKIMGQIDPIGWIKPKTFYGPGQVHDKRRGDIDITKVISDIKNKMKGEGGQLLGEQL